MAILVHNCPHPDCRTSRAAMEVVIVRSLDLFRGYVSLYCPACKKPCSAELFVKSGAINLSELASYDGDLGEDCTVVEFWPHLPKPLVPLHLPPSIEKSVMQAESNFAQHGNEEPAAMMYRRAMETGLKIRYPEVKGSLAQQIDKLVATHAIPAEMGDWAHEIRLAGNEAAHDEEGVSREDLSAIRNFCDTLLRYVFTLPKEIEIRRATRIVSKAT